MPKINCNKSIERLKPYGLVSQPWWEDENQNNGENYLVLNWNERIYPPSPHVVKRLRTFLDHHLFSHYPDVEASALTKAISVYCDVSPEAVQVYCGSDSALETVTRAFLNEGDEAVIAAPTYDNMRVYMESCGASTNFVFGNDLFQITPQELIESVSEATKIVYIVSPNNPTGQVWSIEEISEICSAASNCLVVVDEAYFEFCDKSVVQLTKEFDNLLIVRSFSKAFGLAGLRCGYIVGNADILAITNKIRIGKNVSSIAQIAALASLEDLSYMRQYVQKVTESRDWITKELADINVSLIAGPANFVLINVKKAAEVTALMSRQGVYVRDRSSVNGLENYIRVSLAPLPEMRIFMLAFKAALSKLNLLSS